MFARTLQNGKIVEKMSDTSQREHGKRDAGMSIAAISSDKPEAEESVWVNRLVLFVRAMAVLSMAMGLYHWSLVTGIHLSDGEEFAYQPVGWQAATIYFAVIELVAAVGLWLATPWGAVVWLMTIVSMAAMEVAFPAIYGGSLILVVIQIAFLVIYLVLAWMVARDQPA